MVETFLKLHKVGQIGKAASEHPEDGGQGVPVLVMGMLT